MDYVPLGRAHVHYTKSAESIMLYDEHIKVAGHRVSTTVQKVMLMMLTLMLMTR